MTHDTQNISVLISYIIFLLGSNVKLLNILLYGKCVITSWVAHETFFCTYFAYKWFVFCTFTILCPVHVKCKLVLVPEIYSK